METKVELKGLDGLIIPYIESEKEKIVKDVISKAKEEIEQRLKDVAARQIIGLADWASASRVGRDLQITIRDFRK